MPKIMFNLRPPQGSFGGGSFFVKNMIDYLSDKYPNDYKLVTNFEPDIDLIFMIDPRPGEHKAGGIDTIMNYKRAYPNCKILYAVNECDIKRKVSINVEPLILKSMLLVDYNIFISQWLKDYYLEKYCDNKEFVDKVKDAHVIFNACDLKDYYPQKNKILDRENIKLVTHHWSDNYNKGFEIYNRLDELLTTDRFKHIKFTYIGRYFPNYKPKNINLIAPLSEGKLGNELRKHDVYLTASLYEPGGIHQLEGMASGLPILYRENSGGVKESVGKCGEEYTDINDMMEKLNKIVDNYDKYCNEIDYNFVSHERFGEAYHKYFQNNIFN